MVAGAEHPCQVEIAVRSVAAVRRLVRSWPTRCSRAVRVWSNRDASGPGQGCGRTRPGILRTAQIRPVAAGGSRGGGRSRSRYLVDDGQVGAGTFDDPRGECRAGDVGRGRARDLGGDHRGSSDAGVEGLDAADVGDRHAEAAKACAQLPATVPFRHGGEAATCLPMSVLGQVAAVTACGRRLRTGVLSCREEGAIDCGWNCPTTLSICLRYFSVRPIRRSAAPPAIYSDIGNERCR